MIANFFYIIFETIAGEIGINNRLQTDRKAETD